MARAPRAGGSPGAGEEFGEDRSGRTIVTVAELLGRQPGPTTHQHRQVPAKSASSLGHRVARGVRQHRRGVLLGGLAAVLVAGVITGGILVQQSKDQVSTGDAISPAMQASQWLAAYGAEPVLTDGGFRTNLLHAGWDPGRVLTPASCTPRACPPVWLVITPTLRAGLSGGGPLDAAVYGSTPVAVFSSGDDRLEIRHPGARTAQQTATELRARTAAGRELSRVARVATGPEVRDLLNAGRADPRVIGTLATLAVNDTVRVLDLPAVPGEDAAGQPRRQVLLAVPADGAGALTTFFAAQQGPYRPIDVTQVPTGLLVRYPPVAPPNLLQAFDGP